MYGLLNQVPDFLDLQKWTAQALIVEDSSHKIKTLSSFSYPHALVWPVMNLLKMVHTMTVIVKKCKTFFQISSFVFHRRKKGMQIWNDMRVSKWWQNFNFRWTIPLTGHWQFLVVKFKLWLVPCCILIKRRLFVKTLQQDSIWTNNELWTPFTNIIYCNVRM